MAGGGNLSGHAIDQNRNTPPHFPSSGDRRPPFTWIFTCQVGSVIHFSASFFGSEATHALAAIHTNVSVTRSSFLLARSSARSTRCGYSEVCRAKSARAGPRAPRKYEKGFGVVVSRTV